MRCRAAAAIDVTDAPAPLIPSRPLLRCPSKWAAWRRHTARTAVQLLCLREGALAIWTSSDGSSLGFPAANATRLCRRLGSDARRQFHRLTIPAPCDGWLADVPLRADAWGSAASTSQATRTELAPLARGAHGLLHDGGKNPVCHLAFTLQNEAHANKATARGTAPRGRQQHWLLWSPAHAGDHGAGAAAQYRCLRAAAAPLRRSARGRRDGARGRADAAAAAATAGFNQRPVRLAAAGLYSYRRRRGGLARGRASRDRAAAAVRFGARGRRLVLSPRGYSFDESRRRRGCDVEIP